MKPPNKTGQAAAPRSPSQRPPQARGAVVVQKKESHACPAALVNNRQPPQAPPVYRPQPVPKVLQRKTATPAPCAAPPSASKKTPAAPPVYRPQTTPVVLQRKQTLPATGASAAPMHAPRTPHAPHVRHAPHPSPQPRLTALQPKLDPRSTLGARARAPMHAPYVQVSGVIQRMEEESIADRIKRQRPPVKKEKVVFKSSRLQEKYGEDESSGSSDSDSSEEEVATPPPGKFVTLRSQLSWAAHSTKTGGQRADEYVYSHVDPNDVQTNAAKQNRLEYRCARCGGFFPRKRDRRGKETSIQVDHAPPMSKRLDNAPKFGISGEVCDGTHVWFGILYNAALDCYNDPDLLQLMCSKCNPSKGGMKDYFRDEPTIHGNHPDDCGNAEHV